MTLSQQPDGSRSESDGTPQARPDSDDQGPRAQRVREDLIVRFMGDHTVTIPLWGSRGLMFGDVNALMRAGVPPDLAETVAQWGRDWNEHGTSPELHLRAIELLRPLYVAFDGRYHFVYQP